MESNRHYTENDVEMYKSASKTRNLLIGAGVVLGLGLAAYAIHKDTVRQNMDPGSASHENIEVLADSTGTIDGVNYLNQGQCNCGDYQLDANIKANNGGTVKNVNIQTYHK